MKHITITVGRLSDMILRGGRNNEWWPIYPPPPPFLKKIGRKVHVGHLSLSTQCTKLRFLKEVFLSLSTDKIISKWVFCH